MTTPLSTRAKREVPADFDRVARRYDGLVARNPGYRDHLALSARRLALRGRGAGRSVLDLCCGTGLSTEAILSAYPEASVIGLDASAGMLEVARTKELDGDVTWVHGDAMDPAASTIEGPFDAVLMAYGIRNMPDADACLANLLPLLAPGAPVCFHEYSVADSPRARRIWHAVAWAIIIPGGLLTSGRTPLYRYLWRSVVDFDGVTAFEARLARTGFTDVHTEPLDGWQHGITHSFMARAPNDEGGITTTTFMARRPLA